MLFATSYDATSLKKRGFSMRWMTWRGQAAWPCLDALLALELILGQHLRAGGGGRVTFPWWERERSVQRQTQEAGG